MGINHSRTNQVVGRSRTTRDDRKRQRSDGIEMKTKSSVYYKWTKLQTSGNGPSPRYAHTMACVGSRIFVFGGYCGNYNDNTLYVFDTDLNDWDTPVVQGAAPTGRAFHSCAVVGTAIYFYGGFNQNNLAEIFYLDTDKMTWKYLPVQGVAPVARSEQSLTTIGSYLFLFGGASDTSHLSTVHVFDTESSTWGVAPTTGKAPKARCSHTCSVLGKEVVLYGGYDGATRLKDTKVFDPERAEWRACVRSKDSSAVRRAAHSCVVLGKYMVVFGGYDGKKRMNDVQILDTEVMEWSRPTVNGTPPSPRTYHSACVMEKKIYVFGGYDGKSRSDEMFVLEETMPSLVNICVDYIQRNQKIVGNLNKLPIELRELIVKSKS